MSFQASCPSCAAPVEFRFDRSVVTVCDSCGSVVGRADGALEDLGKVADLVVTDSPLQAGVTGRFRGKGFEISGRTQVQHAGGGIWDEWYLAFNGGKQWGWLAEAQGKYYLTQPAKVPDSIDADTLAGCVK